METTRAVRQVILEHDGEVAGGCVEAGMILAWRLRQDGFSAELESRSAHRDWHWCVRSGPWILDPTSGQWGEDPVLVFLGHTMKLSARERVVARIGAGRRRSSALCGC